MSPALAATVSHAPAVAVEAARYAGAWVELARPAHWVKNAFVLVPLAFVLVNDVATALASVTLAFILFGLLSSAVYCFNDAVDAVSDRHHPIKRLRPVASGRIGRSAAVLVATILAIVGLTTGYLLLPPAFTVVAGLYVVNNLLYSFLLKQRVIVDVISIAIGFVLRLFAGLAAAGVTSSSWFVVCGFSLALVLAFGKRRAEIALPGHGVPYRHILAIYTAEKLDLAMAITASVALLSYMLYTVAPETIRVHGTDKLLYTAPFVVYGLFRYVFKVQEGKGTGPVDVLGTDPVFLVNGLMWGGTVIAILRLG